MKILIVAATHSEISQLYERTELLRKHDDYFSNHLFNGYETDILVTGIGIASTAYRLGKILSKNNYDLALNFGIAGSFNRNIKPGEVVNVEYDIISELGAENGLSFLKFDELKIEQTSHSRTIWEQRNNLPITNSVIQSLRPVTGITVNTVHGNTETIDKIIQLFHPDVETMEGAAFLHICNEEKIKCAQIRSVSNYVELRETANWNIKLAIENLNQKAFEILETL